MRIAVHNTGLFINILSLFSDGKRHFMPETQLGDIIGKRFDVMDWVGSLLSFQVSMNVDIPEELANRDELTIAEFVAVVETLPRLYDKLFPARCVGMMKDIVTDVAVKWAKEEVGNSSRLN